MVGRGDIKGEHPFPSKSHMVPLIVDKAAER